MPETRNYPAHKKGGCSTGYGEDLIKKRLSTWMRGIIETIAHYAAAKHISKEVSFYGY